MPARGPCRLILRETLRPVGVVVLAGMAGAATASQWLESRLFGISPFDPVAFLAAALVLLSVAAAASLLPTREALKVDPLAALRHE